MHNGDARLGSNVIPILVAALLNAQNSETLLTS